jgi:RND family efflux transporter MFP subunit
MRKIILLLLVLALAGGVYAWRKGGDKPVSLGAPAAIPVRVADATPQDFPVYLSGIGNVVSLNQVTVRAQTDGELTEMLFDEGQHVEKGVLLATIDDRRLAADLARAAAEKARVQAELSTAEQDMSRYNNLLADNAIATQLVDQQKALVAQLKAAVQVAQAEIDSAKVQLSYTKIKAPVSGTIGLRRVDAGNIVKASDAEGLVTITQLDPIAVVFTLPQGALGDLVPLMQSEQRPVDILPKEGETPIAMGQLQTLDNEIDSNTGTIRLKAVIPNEDHKLWPGQFVVARIRTRIIETALVVPLSAVQRGRENSFVYRVENGKAATADVNVIYEDAEHAVIEGVNAGDQIVIDGQARLRPDIAVQILGAQLQPQEKQ